uniref:Transmembrane protein n=1 Tax=Macrostomum lignano TaxID=282301 RepID=A0A1I8IPT2_9PLAT
EEMALVEVRFYRLRTGFCSAWCSFLVFTSLAVFRIFIILVIASIVRAGPWRPSHAILLLQSATSVREPGGHLRDVGRSPPARCSLPLLLRPRRQRRRRLLSKSSANPRELLTARPMVAARWRLKRSRSASLAYITAWVISTCIESNSPPVNEPYCRPKLFNRLPKLRSPMMNLRADKELAESREERPTRPRMLVLSAGYWPLFSCVFLSLRCSDAQVANLSPVLRMMLPVNVEQESAAPAAPPHGINGLPHEAMTPLHYSATGRATCHSVRQSSKSSKSMTTRQRQLLAGRVLRRQPLMLLLLLA